MKQEDKDLLLKDLCGCLPYGVKARVYNHWSDESYDEIITIDNLSELIRVNSISDIKPYLFPLSSITEAQKKELQALVRPNAFCTSYTTFTPQDFYCKYHFRL